MSETILSRAQVVDLLEGAQAEDWTQNIPNTYWNSLSGELLIRTSGFSTIEAPAERLSDIEYKFLMRIVETEYAEGLTTRTFVEEEAFSSLLAKLRTRSGSPEM